MGISRDSAHKRRLTGGRMRRIRMKRKYELGRQPASTKIGIKKVTKVRVRGGHYKFRALRLDHGNFTWAGEAVTRKTRIMGVVYNATSNELVRTNTLVKGCIVQIDSTPYKQWYIKYYNVELGKKKGVEEGEGKDKGKKGEAKDKVKKSGEVSKSGEVKKEEVKADAAPPKKDTQKKIGGDPARKDFSTKKAGTKAAPKKEGGEAAAAAPKGDAPKGKKAPKGVSKKRSEEAGDAPPKVGDAPRKAPVKGAPKKDKSKEKKEPEKEEKKKQKRRDITYTVRDEAKLHPETLAKITKRNEGRTFEQNLSDQFRTGRLYAKITSRPGQSGRADGYILEGDELAFYLKKIFAKKSKKPST